jgi:hypothetical protein
MQGRILNQKPGMAQVRLTLAQNTIWRRKDIVVPW